MTGPEVENFVSLYFDDADAQKLSPIVDTAADRFNDGLGLEDDEKADFKIKAKQFVKIYGQMASIMPYEIVAWGEAVLVPEISDPETQSQRQGRRRNRCTTGLGGFVLVWA